MSDFFGTFSWPRFTVDFPVYVTAAATIALAIIAFLQIRHSRQEASSRATLQNLMDERTNPGWLRFRDHFINLRDNGRLKRPETLDGEDLKVVKYVLNRYEIAALGILTSAYDEETYKRYARSIFVNDFIHLWPFIQFIRNNKSSRAFVEFETVAMNWLTEAEKIGAILIEGATDLDSNT